MGQHATVERISAASAGLRSLLEQLPGSPRPSALVISRFGFDGLGSPLPRAQWPAATIRGIGASELGGPAAGRVRLLEWSGEVALGWEWEERAEKPTLASEAALPVWIGARLGVSLIVHLAAGSALADRDVPELVRIEDHLRWDHGDPLEGWPSEEEGARFPQMQAARELIDLDLSPAIGLVRRGPSGWTNAEARMFARLGADVILEGGAVEAIAAQHVGRRWLSLALLLDRADQPQQQLDPGELADRAEQLFPRLDQQLELALQNAGHWRREAEEDAT